MSGKTKNQDQNDAGGVDPLVLAELRRAQLVELFERARALAAGEIEAPVAERRSMLDACRAAATIHGGLVEFEREHGWLPLDGAEERDWQALVAEFVAAAERNDLPTQVVQELLDAMGAS